MQIHLPANYGRRYNEAFGDLPGLAKELLFSPALWRRLISPQWTTAFIRHDVQPFIAD